MRFNIQKTLSALIFSFLMFAEKIFVFAQEDSGRVGDYVAPPGVVSVESGLSEIMGQVSTAILSLAGVVAVIMLIIGGIQYSLSAGDDEARAKAKRTIRWTIFGLLLALLAYAITAFMAKVLG